EDEGRSLPETLPGDTATAPGQRLGWNGGTHRTILTEGVAHRVVSQPCRVGSCGRLRAVRATRVVLSSNALCEPRGRWFINHHMNGPGRRMPGYVCRALISVRRPQTLFSCHRQSGDRKSTRLYSSHVKISYAVFCLKKKKT